MDSTRARRGRKARHKNPIDSKAPDGEERPPSEADAPQASGGAAAEVECLSNTQPSSSLKDKDDERLKIAGGVDWFTWWAHVEWTNPAKLAVVVQILEQAKRNCQEKKLPCKQVLIPEFGEAHVYRMGFNRGGGKGQHYEYKLRLLGQIIGLSPRSLVEPTAGVKKVSPNFCSEQTGRDALLVGPRDGNEVADAFLTALGGVTLKRGMSRGDLCLDIVGLNAADLYELVRLGCFVTRARKVQPHINHVTEVITGFHAGQFPLYLTVYDKVAERRGKSDALYNRALVDRRWNGASPDVACRVELQLGRTKLLSLGVDSPEDFFLKMSAIFRKLTNRYFRLTDRPVDRHSKHQSRYETHSSWKLIQDGGIRVFGEPLGDLIPIQRQKVEPKALMSQGRGCIAKAMLQKGIPIASYKQFVEVAGTQMLTEFPSPAAREDFIRQYNERALEFEVS